MKIYPKQIIKCTCADIYCQWKRKREDLHIHLETCWFQKIRPIIDQLIEEIQKIKQTQSEQQRFIEAFMNNGYNLSDLCTINPCYFARSPIENKPYLMTCSLCNQQLHFVQISLHSCLTNSCICKSCFHQHTQQQ